MITMVHTKSSAPQYSAIPGKPGAQYSVLDRQPRCPAGNGGHPSYLSSFRVPYGLASDLILGGSGPARVLLVPPSFKLHPPASEFEAGFQPGLALQTYLADHLDRSLNDPTNAMTPYLPIRSVY